MPAKRKVRPERLMSLFQELSEKLEIRIINGKGDFSGGTCRIREDRVVVINNRKPIEQRLMILARSFGKLDLSCIYIVPVLRAYIDENSTDPFAGELT